MDMAQPRGGRRDGWDVVDRASELARHGEEFALATVVWRLGPSSGQRGAHAIVTASGEVHGWIGGACAEPSVIREAQRAIVDGEPRLLLLGTPEQFGAAVPPGMTVIPISCQSEGAMEVFIEPVVPVPHVVVIGRSPMAQTLVDLSAALGWRAELIDVSALPSLPADAVGPRSIVVVATQGHGDEEAMERAIAAAPAYVGFVASRRRGESVLGYLADRGIPQSARDQVHVPAGLDLGATSHREIAVAILAELVQLRASGALRDQHAAQPAPAAKRNPIAQPHPARATALDPVCGMTVNADSSALPYEHDGQTYYFCSAGCRTRFEREPAAFVQGATC
jgi:xanthine dehydrogenase accessory factor